MSKKKYIDADIVNLKLKLKQICDNHNTSYGIQFFSSEHIDCVLLASQTIYERGVTNE